MEYFLVLSDAAGNHSTHQHKGKINSLGYCKAVFRKWMNEVGRYADEQNAQGLIYGSDPSAEQDPYPLAELTVGKNGGLVYTKL